LDVVEGDDSFDGDNDGKDTGQFGSVWVDVVWAAWCDIGTQDAVVFTISSLENKSCGAKGLLIGSIADCNGCALEDGSCDMGTVVGAMEGAKGPLIVAMNEAKDGTGGIVVSTGGYRGRRQIGRVL
jgi:hypothetical protein